MALKIDRVQLQFEIKPDYDQKQLLALKEDLKKANRELSQTEREIEKLKKAKPVNPSDQAQWRAQLDLLNKKYQEQVVAVQNAQRAVDKHVEKMGLENLSMAELTNRAKTLNTILRNLNPNSPSYTEYKNKLEQINARYGTTMLIVTHNNSIKNMVHKVIFLKDGLVKTEYMNENRISASELEDL
jgi:DNA repair ATPase RecN